MKIQSPRERLATLTDHSPVEITRNHNQTLKHLNFNQTTLNIVNEEIREQ